MEFDHNNELLQSHDLNAELLDVYDSINEKDKLKLFIYHHTSSSSSTNQVKPAILWELKLFQDECRKRMNNYNKEINSGTNFPCKKKRLEKSDY